MKDRPEQCTNATVEISKSRSMNTGSNCRRSPVRRPFEVEEARLPLSREDSRRRRRRRQKELYSVIRMLPLLRVFNNNNNNNNNVCRRHLILPCKLKVAAVIKQRMFQRLTTTARTREEEREAYSSPAISDAHKIRLYSPREAKVLSTAHQRPTGEEEDEEESVSTIRETLSLEAAPKSSARPPSPSPWKANLAGLPRLSNTNEKKVVEAPSSSSRAKRTSSHGWSRTKTIGR